MSSLSTLTTAALGGPEWLNARRGEATEAFEASGLPSATEEVWRYSPIGDLDLEGLELAGASQDEEAPEMGAGIVLHLSAGRTGALPVTPNGLVVSSISTHPDGAALLGVLASISDPMVALNTATLVDGIVIDVARGVALESPILIVHHAGAGLSTPRVIVRLGEGSQAEVVEFSTGGGEGTINVPVTEILVGESANLRYGAIEDLGAGAWHLATVKAQVGRDGTIAQLTAGLGASYDRIRTDVALAGQGASSILRSTFLGTGSQVHDLRTVQDHIAPRTNSDLLCKGAVDDEAHSIYTGVIQVRNGAIRSDANQTNKNLLLSTEARADSVPNLDISENDVRCSHASSVGPLDEDQRYYLESRGVGPEMAEQLLIRGFFRDLLERSTLVGPAEWVRAQLEARLGERA